SLIFTRTSYFFLNCATRSPAFCLASSCELFVISCSPMLKPNRAFVEFSRRLKEAREIFQPWKGTIYRVTTLKYRDPRIILFGEGSYRNGGRWNAIESFRAVYGSTEATVALAEQQANATYANLPYPFREPRLIVALDIELSR